MTIERRSWLLLLSAIALYATLAGTALLSKSATFDEGVYIAAGVSQITTGDHCLIPVHPPLAKLLAGALPVLAGVRADYRDESWLQANPWAFAHRLVYRWNDPRRVVALARVPSVALGCLLAAAVFGWTLRHWGFPAAALALVLTALNPDLLAHGQLATSDMAVTVFVFLAVVAFERLTARISWGRLLATGLAAGGAITAKFSGLVLAPLFLVLAAVVLLDRQEIAVGSSAWPGGRRLLASRAERFRHVSGALCLVALVALVVVWATYGFRYRASSDPARQRLLSWHSLAEARTSPVRSVALAARDSRLVPEAYAFGLLETASRSKKRPAFLMGERSNRGWWYFFPVAFALKAPLAWLVLLGLTLSAGSRASGPARTEWFLWTPVVVYLAFCLTSHVDIGVRYLLPAYPFLLAATGRCATLAAKGGIGLRAFVGGAVLWYASAAARIHPHYLAHFNELAGGPAGGYRFLVDSSLDWGQDLPGLAAFVRKAGLERIKLSYFGTADPRSYGIPCELLPGAMRPAPERLSLWVRAGDVVAVSATNLQGVYLPSALLPLMDRLRSLQPIAVIGHSIRIYRADATWLLPPDDAVELGWLDFAVESYAEAIQDEPGSADAHGYLAYAYHRRGQRREAAAELAAAQHLDPSWLDRHPRYRRVLATRTAPELGGR